MQNHHPREATIMSMSFGIQALILFVFIFSITACTQNDGTVPSSTAVNVTLPNTEVRQLKSSATGREYDIYVRLPDGYKTDQGKQYPVIYSLDGQWDFKMLDSICGGLVYDKFIPEVIIVGITYSGQNADYGALRAKDYTPVRDLFFGGAGDGPKFLAFLKEQLIPFIESNYRVDPSQRVLMGSSFGGTFTLYALFSDPTLFQGYLAGSPVVVYGNRFAFQQEAEYASSHADLPVRLFISVGGAEELAYPVEEFMQVLRDRKYRGLALETLIVEGEGHASNKPESYNRGLRFVFQK
jgi:predicted alpha/beta superfamily hydrolase